MASCECTLPPLLATRAAVAACVEGVLPHARPRACCLAGWGPDARAAAAARRVFGWTRANEINNGRWVMFGLLVGLMTEYATGEARRLALQGKESEEEAPRGGRGDGCACLGRPNSRAEQQLGSAARTRPPLPLLYLTLGCRLRVAARRAGVSFIDQLKQMASYMGLVDLD